MFVFTATICVLTKQPLVFSPINYSLVAFLRFALLIVVLCFLLVFICLPFLNSLKPNIKAEGRNESFFLFGTIIILQLVTMITGYAESSFSRGVRSDLFYYYKGVGNSFIYILTGNLTSMMTASLYAKEQTKRKKMETETKLKLEKVD